jgi:chromate reductase, NAD(P)H dehydrogenase (quinone)
MHLLGISGSLRADSLNGLLLAAGLEHAPDTWTTSTYDALRHIPPFDADAEEPAPEAVAHLRAAIAEADAVLFATPEYNSSIPGQLKNALDWASRPFATNPLRNRPVVVVSASDGLFGAVWAAAELRKVLARIGARVVDADLGVPEAHTAFGPDGRLLDPELDARLADAVAALAAEVRPAHAVR